MVTIVRIDSQGRILIPVEMRRRMNLDQETEVEIIIIGSEIVIRKKQQNLEANVNTWMKDLVNTTIPTGITEEDSESWDKWMDNEYIEKKLGIR